MSDLAIVIVGHDHCRELMNVLQSLYAVDHQEAFSVVLVDNASTDGTAEAVQRHYPHVNLIQNPERYGFAKNVNIGIKQTGDEPYILVLNPDIVCHPHSIDRLMTFIRSVDDAGVVGAKLIYPDGSTQYSCRRFSNPLSPFIRLLKLDRLFSEIKILHREFMLDYDHATTKDVDYVIGACMLLRRDALNDVGTFDEKFFLYYEDQDLCYRMWKNGWKVFYVPESEMTHEYRRESAKKFLSKIQRIHLQSMMYLYQKHGLILSRPLGRKAQSAARRQLQATRQKP